MDQLPLFERSSRRALLRMGLGATGVITAGALLAACGGNDDKGAFASDTTAASSGSDTTAASSGAETTASGGDTTAAAVPDTTVAAATTTAAPADSTVASASGAAVQLDVTYTPSSTGGRVRNPYVAVWVEDSANAMVGIIGLMYSQRDAKYLRELTEFMAAATPLTNEAADAVTGATRQAGAYQFEWDGLGLDGSALTGDYTIYVEAAREHGPHTVISGSVTLGQSGSATITGDGELSDVAVTVV